VENLRKLEVIKLIKELDFLESQYKFKTEVLKEVDFEFKKEVEVILTNNQELEEVFTKSVNYINDKRTEHLNTYQPEIEEEEIVVEKNPKVKSLYRIIAKATHPDKKNDDSLTEIYLEATKAYENNELLPIISICDKLKIPFEIDQDEFENIKKEIEKVKTRTSFLETTYTWKWYTANDLVQRSEIVLNFIKAQIL
jgi:hypothetical protein